MQRLETVFERDDIGFEVARLVLRRLSSSIEDVDLARLLIGLGNDLRKAGFGNDLRKAGFTFSGPLPFCWEDVSKRLQGSKYVYQNGSKLGMYEEARPFFQENYVGTK